MLLAALLLQAQLGPAKVQAELPYADVSKKFQLGDADRLMRDGKFLEAAVAYRNALLQPGDRELVRIPFALALFAHGDAGYAGVELRRASTLCDDFARLSLDAADLFGSRGALAKIADRIGREKPEGDGAERDAMLAFVLHLAGEEAAATDAVGRYAVSRGEDAFAKALRAKISGAPEKKPAPAGRDADKLQQRVDQIGGAPAGTRAGEPARAGTRYLETPCRPRGEIIEK